MALLLPAMVWLAASDWRPSSPAAAIAAEADPRASAEPGPKDVREPIRALKGDAPPAVSPLERSHIVSGPPFVWPQYEMAPPTPRPLPKAKAVPPTQDWAFRIECAIVEEDEHGTRRRLMCPVVQVVEGTRALIDDTASSPVVSAVKAEGGKDKPLVHVLAMGTTVNVTAYGNKDGRVTLDASVEVSDIAEIDGKHGRQSARVKSHRTRAIQCVQPGEKLTVQLDPFEGRKTRRSVEFVVTAVKPAPQVVTVVYQVDGVLGLPTTGPVVAPPDAQLEALIALVKREVLPGTWEDQGGPGTIAAFPSNCAVVVSHTPAAQEQVAKLLERMRKDRSDKAATKVAGKSDPLASDAGPATGVSRPTKHGGATD